MRIIQLFFIVIIFSILDCSDNKIIDSKQFYLAVCEDNYNVVQKYIKQGGDLNIKFEYLLKNDKEIKLHKNVTAIMAASYNNKNKILKLLIDSGADVNIANDNGWTALMWAAMINDKNVELLINAGANVNIKNINGWTALMSASYFGKPQIINLLLKSGANINSQNTDGWTALMWAAYMSHNSAVKILLNAGANTNLLNNHGEDALRIANSENNYNIVNILEQYNKK